MNNAVAQKSATIKNFAAAATAYDKYASIQRQSARDLLDFTLPSKPASILEPGCGTGIYTGMLLGAFPQADIQCIDIASEMLDRSRSKFRFQATFVEADAEEYAGEPVDLISSNATFQWFSDLDGTIRRYRNMLEPNGQLTFSFYGPGTYGELNEALTRATNGQHRVLATDFASKDELAQTFSACFNHHTIEERTYTDNFTSLIDLLRTIKYTGVRGHTRELGLQWTPRIIAKTRRIYRRIYGEIKASYQVFLCRGAV